MKSSPELAVVPSDHPPDAMQSLNARRLWRWALAALLLALVLAPPVGALSDLEGGEGKDDEPKLELKGKGGDAGKGGGNSRMKMMGERKRKASGGGADKEAEDAHYRGRQQQHHHAAGGRFDYPNDAGGGGGAPSGEGTALRLGPIDFSVAGIEGYSRVIGFARDPLKLLFGVGLLLYGRDFAHLILFSQAFKVTGYQLASAGVSQIKSDYVHFTSRVDKQAVSPLYALRASLAPSAVRSVLAGVYSGIVACIAAVVSPIAGATGVGLSIGSMIEPQMQPLIEAQLAKRGHSMARWVNFGASSAPHVVSVVLSLLTKNYINTLSGCLIGSKLVTQVIAKHIGALLKQMATRIDNPRVQKFALGFSDGHPAVNVASVLVAIAAFGSQLRNSSKLNFPMKLVLGAPVLVEKVMRALKWGLIGRGSPQ